MYKVCMSCKEEFMVDRLPYPQQCPPCKHEPGRSFQHDSRFFSWDENAQPEWGEINDAVQDLWMAGDPPPFIFSVPETGYNSYGVIVTNWGLTSQQKIDAWRYWSKHREG